MNNYNINFKKMSNTKVSDIKDDSLTTKLRKFDPIFCLKEKLDQPEKRIKNSLFQLKTTNIFDNDEVYSKDKYLEIIKEIFTKKEGRTFNDHQIVFSFLKTMTGFLDIITRGACDSSLLNEILTTISFYLGYEKFNKDNILFRYGDVGDKFYIILKGSINILIARERRIMMSELDYVNYLTKLKKYNEIEILIKCLHINRFALEIEGKIEKGVDGFNNETQFKSQKQSIGNKNSQRNSKYFTPRQSIKNIQSPENSNNNNEVKCPSRNSAIIRKMSLQVVGEMSNRFKIIPSLELINETTDNSKSPLLEDKVTSVSTEEYINRIKVYERLNVDDTNFKNNVDDNELSPKSRFVMVTVFEYHLVASLSTGQSFGEMALENANQKRTATIISTEETHLGILNAEIYIKSVREVNEKFKKQILSFLLSNILFKEMNRHIFSKRYYNEFVCFKINRGEKLQIENEEIRSLSFIRDGEYDVTINKSLYDLTEIIKVWDKSNQEPLFGKEELQTCNLDKEFKKNYHQKRKIRLSIIKGKDILGLEDFLIGGKSAITVECTSNVGEIFRLELKFFNIMCNNTENIKENRDEIKNMKKDLLLEKFIKIREIKLTSIKNLIDRKVENYKSPIISNSKNKDDNRLGVTNDLIRKNINMAVISIYINPTIANFTRNSKIKISGYNSLNNISFKSESTEVKKGFISNGDKEYLNIENELNASHNKIFSYKDRNIKKGELREYVKIDDELIDSNNFDNIKKSSIPINKRLLDSQLTQTENDQKENYEKKTERFIGNESSNTMKYFENKSFLHSTLKNKSQITSFNNSSILNLGKSQSPKNLKKLTRFLNRPNLPKLNFPSNLISNIHTIKPSPLYSNNQTIINNDIGIALDTGTGVKDNTFSFNTNIKPIKNLKLNKRGLNSDKSYKISSYDFNEKITTSERKILKNVSYRAAYRIHNNLFHHDKTSKNTLNNLSSFNVNLSFNRDFKENKENKAKTNFITSSCLDKQTIDNVSTTGRNNIVSKNLFSEVNSCYASADNNSILLKSMLDKDTTGYALNEYHLKPDQPASDRNDIANNNSIIITFNKMAAFENKNWNRNIINKKPEMLLDIKMPSIRTIEFNEEEVENNLQMLDKFGIQKRKEEKFIKLKKQLKLTKTEHSMFRFSASKR